MGGISRVLMQCNDFITMKDMKIMKERELSDLSKKAMGCVLVLLLSY